LIELLVTRRDDDAHSPRADSALDSVLPEEKVAFVQPLAPLHGPVR